MIKSGRPRVEHQPEFWYRFASILPALEAGEISKGQAAKLLGISHRSLSRYMILAEDRGLI